MTESENCNALLEYLQEKLKSIGGTEEELKCLDVDLADVTYDRFVEYISNTSKEEILSTYEEMNDVYQKAYGDAFKEVANEAFKNRNLEFYCYSNDDYSYPDINIEVEIMTSNDDDFNVATYTGNNKNEFDEEFDKLIDKAIMKENYFYVKEDVVISIYPTQELNEGSLSAEAGEQFPLKKGDILYLSDNKLSVTPEASNCDSALDAMTLNVLETDGNTYGCDIKELKNSKIASITRSQYEELFTELPLEPRINLINHPDARVSNYALNTPYPPSLNSLISDEMPRRRMAEIPEKKSGKSEQHERD